MATRTGPCYPSRACSGPALPIAQAQTNAFQGFKGDINLRECLENSSKRSSRSRFFGI